MRASRRHLRTVRVLDEPGMLGDVALVMSKAGINIDSVYPLLAVHLARDLTSKAALEGERKQVTVLFADLKGSMELLAERSIPKRRGRPLIPSWNEG